MTKKKWFDSTYIDILEKLENGMTRKQIADFYSISYRHMCLKIQKAKRKSNEKMMILNLLKEKKVSDYD